MIKIENYEVYGWMHAIRGMRNPLESWDKCDSFYWDSESDLNEEWGVEKSVDDLDTHVHIGPNDLDLMTRLRNAGRDHRKYMRMIDVWFDITAPMYWWKEFDTYKIGTVRNSCSTMHKIHAKEFTLEDFSCEHLISDMGPDKNPFEGWLGVEEYDGHVQYHSPKDILEVYIINALNECREAYLKTKDKKYWYQMIQLLPSSYNQRSTIKLNYEVLANMYHSRKNHKLDEWREFCKWIESLPYSELITGKEESDESK